MASSGTLLSASKFFNIIFEPLQHTLRIPPAFMRRCERNLPNPVFLKVPSDLAMEVELSRSNGETFLRKGWKEFKERYSIGVGYLLIFEYNGKSQFDVMIYDMSATEIDYPIDSDSEIEDNGSESDDSVVMLQPFSRPKGKAKLVEDSGTGRQRKRRMKLQDRCSERQCWDSVKKQKAVSKETSRAYQEAIARKFSNPFFTSLMQPSYVFGRCSLNVPFAFAKGNMPPKNANLTLRLRNGKTWAVRCSVSPGSVKMSGWKKFVQDNELKLGDACVFEAVEGCVWNVYIFKN